MKLFLKGERCYSEKCAITRRNYAPGQHGQRRPKPSEYGLQLREKQKVKRIYGVFERQFRSYFTRADRRKGVTGENLLLLLEQRLDSVVYRLGFASSRAQARQLVSHGHFTVNGRKVDIPSYLAKSGDIIQVRERSRTLEPIIMSLETVEQRGIPTGLN
jgi:small subunit ribosomal protein S4